LSYGLEYRRAPGISRTSSPAQETGVTASSYRRRPASASAGGQQRAPVERAAREQVAVADARVGLHLLAPGLDHDRLRRRRRERLGAELLRQPAADDVVELREGRVGEREARRGAREDEPAEERRLPCRQHHGDRSAHAAADEHAAPEAERGDEALDEHRVLLDAPEPVDPAGAPVPGQVERHGAVLGTEPLELAAPHPRVAARGVHEQEQVPAIERRRHAGERRRSRVQVVDRGAVDGDVLREQGDPV
jgi:hypothetical protein